MRKRRRAGWSVGQMSPARREHDCTPLPAALDCRGIGRLLRCPRPQQTGTRLGILREWAGTANEDE